MTNQKIANAFLTKFLIIAALASGVVSTGCSWLKSSFAVAKTPPDELFYVVKYDPGTPQATRGFMDKTGKIVLGPWRSFEWHGVKYGEDKNTSLAILPFVEGMAGICLYDDGYFDKETAKCGFLDKTGKLAVEPKYKQIGYFSEGLAAVSTDADSVRAKFGYIDKTGKLVIEPKFISKAAFHDSLAWFNVSVNQAGYMDKTGKVVFETKMPLLGNFDGGYALVGNFGNPPFITDKTGKLLGQFETESGGNTDYYYKKTFKRDFYEGYANEDRWMTSFGEGLAMSYDRAGTKIGFVNPKGEYEIKLDPTLVGEIRPFSEGFAPIGWRVKDEDKLNAIFGADVTEGVLDWTYVDRKGEIKVNLEDTFRDARPFSEGMAAVKPRKGDGRWTFINAQFQEAMPPCFESVNDFRAGLAAVRVVEYANEKTGCERYYTGDGADAREIYVDKAGNMIKPQW